MHSAHSLPRLCKLPEELLDANYPAYNKGRVYYTNAPRQVIDAYATQFAKETTAFLSARAKEAVSGGIMVLLNAGRANEIADSCAFANGKTSEALVDSFNVPVYTPSPEEMTAIIEQNGCFSIEKMDLTFLNSKVDSSAMAYGCTLHVRAAAEASLLNNLEVRLSKNCSIDSLRRPRNHPIV